MTGFICTGRQTHPPAVVPAGEQDNPRSAIELRCPVCGRTVRLGWRAQQRLMRLVAGSHTDLTGRRKPSRSAPTTTITVRKRDTPIPPAITGPVDISIL